MLDAAEEAKFAELKDKCRELKVPAPPEIMIGLKVHDKDGVLIFDDVQRGHSWTRNFYNFLFGVASTGAGTAATFGAGYLTRKETGGTVGAMGLQVNNRNSVNFLYNTTNNASYGTVVGTSDTAFSVEHYQLQALIAHGNGAGQFFYAIQDQPVTLYTGGAKTWASTSSRIFNNNSGGSITVKEVGLIYYGFGFSYSLFERSVLAPTVAVANGAQLTVTYKISMDFSAID